MKKNAGIYIRDKEKCILYSDLYLDAFRNCDLFCGWELQGDCIQKEDQSYIENNICQKNSQMIWACSLEIYHYIYSNPWTLALRGKRILIISPFIHSIVQQLENKIKIYDGFDLFPDCTFVFIKPPMTQGDEKSQDFDTELNNFYIELDKYKNLYDVALLSCGGYGNLISNYILTSHKKSAIYVGGVLQMYFGIIGNRWITDRPEIIMLYQNNYWKRPNENERPNGYSSIEEACYW
jgi:hypothetical protein